jgi:hypothetical protein
MDWYLFQIGDWSVHLVVMLKANSASEAVRLVREEFRRHQRQVAANVDEGRASFILGLPGTHLESVEVRISPQAITEEHIVSILPLPDSPRETG